MEQSSRFLFSYIKCYFVLTTRRLIIKHPNMFLFIPMDKSFTTYPLKNISAVTIDTRFDFTALHISIVFGRIGVMLINSSVIPVLSIIGVLFIFIVLLMILEYIDMVISIVYNSCTKIGKYSILHHNRKQAKQLVNAINDTITQNI